MTTTCALAATADPPVLAAENRLRRPAEFAAAVQAGQRAARGTVVVHLKGHTDAGLAGTAGTAGHGPGAAPRAGVAVSRAVGGAVVRSQVKRRLRHQIRACLGGRLEALAPGSVLVVRALPTAAAASSARLGADLDAALTRLGVHP